LKFGFFGLQNLVFGSFELKRAENVENCVSSFFWVGANVEIILSELAPGKCGKTTPFVGNNLPIFSNL
jgi:hypothetical protein